MEEETTSEGKELNEVMTSDILAPGDLGLPLAVLSPVLGACSVPSSPCERDHSNDPNNLPPEIGEDDQINLLEEDTLMDTQETDALLHEPATSRAVPEAPSRSTNDTLVEDVIQELCERASEHSQSNNYEEEGFCDSICCSKKTGLIFKSMRRAKMQGWAMFKRLAFPLVPNIV